MSVEKTNSGCFDCKYYCEEESTWESLHLCRCKENKGCFYCIHLHVEPDMWSNYYYCKHPKNTIQKIEQDACWGLRINKEYKLCEELNQKLDCSEYTQNHFIGICLKHLGPTLTIMILTLIATIIFGIVYIPIKFL